MVRNALSSSGFAAVFLVAGAASAMENVSSRGDFLDILGGRDLTIPLYGLSLTVSADGRIDGRAVGRSVTGDWSWQDGYFCRSMKWGQRDIPYNCQLVQAHGNKLRFTTDRGDGDYADFRLR